MRTFKFATFFNLFLHPVHFLRQTAAQSPSSPITASESANVILARQFVTASVSLLSFVREKVIKGKEEKRTLTTSSSSSSSIRIPPSDLGRGEETDWRRGKGGHFVVGHRGASLVEAGREKKGAVIIIPPIAMSQWAAHARWWTMGVARGGGGAAFEEYSTYHAVSPEVLIRLK